MYSRSTQNSENMCILNCNGYVQTIQVERIREVNYCAKISLNTRLLKKYL